YALAVELFGDGSHGIAGDVGLHDRSGEVERREGLGAVSPSAVPEGAGHVVHQRVAPVLLRGSYETKGRCPGRPPTVPATLVPRGPDSFLDRVPLDLGHDRRNLDEDSSGAGGCVDTVDRKSVV